MRMIRLVAAIGIVSVLAGGITAGLIFARDQAPPAAVPGIVVSVPDSAAMPGPGRATALAPRLVAMPEGDPTAVPGGGPHGCTGGLNSWLCRSWNPRPTLRHRWHALQKGTTPALKATNPGTVYTWQDGDRTLRVVPGAPPSGP